MNVPPLTPADVLDDLSDPRQRCFLCGCDLRIEGATAEHVVPQWAQRKYSLWNQRLALLNGTEIKYSHLTVPCCSTCNGQHLKRIEDSLSQCVDSGREAVVALGDRHLFLWLGKLFYGVLYKELMLLKDRSDPKKGTIITDEFLRIYRMHRYFLQQARGILELRDFSPGTIYVFEMQNLKEPRHRWDMVDFVPSLAIGVRVGRVAIIGALADGGAQTIDSPTYERFYRTPLHPIQFRELFARISYRASLATRTPKYVTMQGTTGPEVAYQMPLGGFSAKPLFEEWRQADYARVLAYYAGTELDTVFDPARGVRTWLESQDGEVTYLDFEKYPFFAGEPKG